MILVIGTATVIAALVAVTMAMAIQSLRSSREHVTFESALSVAETGVDETLSLINTAYNAAPSTTWVTPSPCDWTITGTFASAAAERTAARSKLLSLATNSACRKQAGSGEYVAVHPTGKQTVYSLGFAPSYAKWISDPADSKTRLIKAEYIFAPYKPGQAVLTSGNLDFSGSLTVNTLNPSYPADIHSNTNITGGGSGSLTVQGTISSSGTNAMAGSCPSGVVACTQNQPLERVPAVSPRSVYDKLAMTTSNWYDLCPGGVIKVPASTGPCTGALNVEQPSGGAFHGWSYTAGDSTTVPVWTLQRQSGTTTYPGVYYVYAADAQVGDNGNDATVWNITVLSEGAKGADKPAGYSNPARCDKYGGNLDWKLFTIQNYLSGLIFDAEGTLSGTANTSASAGFMWAGDNVNLHTSSNTLTGAIVSNNLCAAAGGNTVQGVTVNYDQTIEGPVSDIIRTTLWLEYVGN